MITPTKNFLVCPKCGTFSPPGFEETPHEIRRVNVRMCPTCLLKERKERWQVLCPKQFLGTSFDKLPNTTASADALNWKPGNRGLMLWGETRRGKSRTAWMVCERWFMAGRNVMAPTSLYLSVHLPALMFSDMETASRMIQSWCDTSILLLDDVFKVKLTERIEQVLFGVIDERTQEGRPILVTCNDTEASLLARMSQDRGPALVSRLNEFCDCIQF